MTHSAKFEYPHDLIYLILRNSFHEDIYYGVDKFERRRLNILMAKYGCQHSYHTLPGKIKANLYPFHWDRLKQCFTIELDRKVPVQLNTLEEAMVNYALE